jgi:hypothetical protein
MAGKTTTRSTPVRKPSSTARRKPTPSTAGKAGSSPTKKAGSTAASKGGAQVQKARTPDSTTPKREDLFNSTGEKPNSARGEELSSNLLKGWGMEESGQADASKADSGKPSEPTKPGAVRGEDGRVNGFQSADGDKYSFGYGDDKKLNQMTDPSGVKWDRQDDGTWKNSNGQTGNVALGDKNFSVTTDQNGGDQKMSRFDMETGKGTEWNKERGDENFHRPLKNGDTQNLYKDGSTVDRDGYNRITDFDGQGGIQSEIKKISQMTDPKQRNLQITQMYSDLSNVIGKQIPGGGANWSSWAAHASNEAGAAIRGERFPVPKGTSATADSYHKTMQMAIGRGNNLVFSEVAPELARFAGTIKGMDSPNQGTMDKFNASLKDKPALQNAFQNYHDAKFASNNQDKRAKMLKGNVQIGIHEQLRLDNMIDTAMFSGETPGGNLAQKGATKMLMSLPLPDGKTESLANAGDWSNFGSRMSVIQDMFTRRHMDPSVMKSPFQGMESVDIINGHTPTRFR